MAESFDSLVNRVNTFKSILSEHQKQLIIDTNFNKDGSVSRASHISKRGHAGETDQAFTLIENYVANMGDLKGIYVATDRVSYNGQRLPVNDQYKDIIVKDLTNNITRSYQSKICKDARSSLIAATNPKYLDAGVIPLVPQDHCPEFSTISINVNGKRITSDPRTLKQMNDITAFYENGGYIHTFGEPKMRLLHMNAVKIGATDGAKTAFVHRAIGEAVNYLTSTKDDSKTALQTCSSIVASTIDGAVRGALVNDSAFKENPKLARCIAENSYSIAKACYNYVASGCKDESLKDKISSLTTKNGEIYLTNMFSMIGSNMGSRFGITGSKVGRLLGSGIGKTITRIINESNVGNTALKALGTTLAFNGLLGGAMKSIDAITGATIAKVTGGIKTVLSSIGGFAAAHPFLFAGIGLLSLFLFSGASEDVLMITSVMKEKERIINEINELFYTYKAALSHKALEDYESLASLFYDTALRNKINKFMEEKDEQIREINKDYKMIEVIKEITTEQKALYDELSKGLPQENVFSFIEKSADFGSRHFFSSRQIMEMAHD